jgi:hypothetical protein
MLRLMLDAHPHISNPGEFDFLIDHMGADGSPPDMQRYRRALATDRIFQAAGLTIDPSLSYGELMQSFFQQLRRDGRVLTLNIHRHFERLPCISPDSRYIHLVRDPRDVAGSSIGMGWAGNIYRGVDIWAEAERSWERLLPALAPQRYLEVRYEDLLENPVAELTGICRFLGLDYSPSMMRYPEHSTYAAPDSRLRYQWKGKCTTQELQWVDWKLGSMLARNNYAPSGFPPRKPTLAELAGIALQDKYHRVRFRIRRYGLALWLENLIASRARMLLWRESCQRRMNHIDVKFLK